jgi:hypothetical protein
MTTQRTSLIQLLRSNTFAIYIAIASVIVQSFHSFYAFYKISSLNGSNWGIAQAVLFAVIVDCAVLFYTVRKNTKVTWLFAFVMVLINLYVYYVHLGLSFDFILGALISFVIPVSNYFYSEEIDDPMDIEYESGQREEVLKLEKELEEMAIIADTLNHRLKNTEADLAIERSKPIPTYPKGGIVQGDEPGATQTKSESEKKGFASLKSEAQENPPTDKSLLNVVHTDRPNKEI